MILAMFSMVLLTFVVGFYTFYVRVNSVKKGLLKPRYFLLMQDNEPPENVIKTSRNFSNQFEMPMLFYVISTLILVTQTVTEFTITLAWLFVIFRSIHAWIHLTYNHLLHRIIAFWLANIVVLAMWIDLLIRYYFTK
ncbi:MAPEG family protein [Catenovulum adriaticum]|uniref:MAPEG family protein n=1 Tax=Catenovulum adriaticum TaxID=2984846 RepID=A0ABY7ARE4_9ALTE|nr:MAPEG family protein [Catenovulum sp. TS8]WAJ72108.1 MAPEG family protein [Catenovulum sp. TS8]